MNDLSFDSMDQGLAMSQQDSSSDSLSRSDDSSLPFTDQSPSRSEIETCQLARLNAMLGRVREHSAFYRKHLPFFDLESLEQLVELPFTSAEDIVMHGPAFLSVPAQEVSRMVAIPTSGTQGVRKRIACTEADLEGTRAFFAEGIRCIARPGEATAVLFPCGTAGSLGRLIADALRRIGARVLLLGLPHDPGKTLRELSRASTTSVVGSARTMLNLARHSTEGGPRPPIARVLLSSDNASDAVKDEIAHTWGCEVFEHYGMTETGFGAAVDCRAHAGMHLRERDLIVEIVDPATGNPLPDGKEGEVVVTTLTREAMPLIRYRTGDVSHIIAGDCPCGGTLRRLGRVHGHALVTPGPNPPSWKL